MNSAFSATERFSEQIYPSPMLILIDPEFYDTFSKYYLRVSFTASVFSVSYMQAVKHLKMNPYEAHCQETKVNNTQTHTKTKEKQNQKKEEGEFSHKLLRLMSTFKAGRKNPKKDKCKTQIRRKVV